LVHPAELLAYAALGVFGGVVSLLFCKGLLALRAAFLRLPPRTRIVQPAIGGVIIGAILLYSPAIMGVGYEYVDQALNGGLLLKTMAILCFLKARATIVSYASGNSGGIFAPSLYIGAMAGGAVGMVVHRVATAIAEAPIRTRGVTAARHRAVRPDDSSESPRFSAPAISLTTARACCTRAAGARLREISMYSITVDPQRDTPAVLRAYARMARA
jgi:hypothetical protein